MLSLNEMERGIISERTSHILQNKKKNKEVYSRTPPYGYKKSGKSLIKVPKELEKVSRVLSMRKTGKSVRSISIDLVLGYNRVKRIIKDEEFYSS
jgi:DNA invertase Pin-like site-specific DNA recombinase